MSVCWRQWIRSFYTHQTSTLSDELQQMRSKLLLMLSSNNAANLERLNGVLRRVARHMRNREASDAIIIWKEKQDEDHKKERGEKIMRRVGGRMRNLEVSLNWAQWHQNCRQDMASMW